MVEFNKNSIKLLIWCFFIILLGIGEYILINMADAETNTLLPRTGHKMVYDTINKQIIMFGGEVDGGSIADFKATLIFSSLNQTWTEISDINSPESRTHHSMVYNSLTGKVLLFGGSSTTEIAQFNDTWVFDTSTYEWTELYPENAPSGRSAHAMYYDSELNEVVLYGGSTPYSVSNEMWIFNFTSNNWYQIFPSYGPGMRYGHSFVYNEREHTGVFFGGRYGNSGLQNDIWFFNRASSSWVMKYQTTKPMARYFAGMVYNPADENFIMFGGDNEDIPLRAMDDTWIYNAQSNEWSEVETSAYPPPRCKYAIIFDEHLGKVIAFGGLGESFSVMYNDLWIFDPNTKSWSQEFIASSASVSMPIWIILFNIICCIGVNHLRKFPTRRKYC